MEQDRLEQVPETVELEETGEASPEETAAPEEPKAETPEEKKKDPPGSGIYQVLHDFVYIFAFVTIIFVFAIRLVGVDGDSMYPTLHHGDYLCLLSNALYNNIERGDVIVVTRDDGEFAGEPIVKRVIATEGQTVDIDFDEGIVYVDGEPLNEPYINEPTWLSYHESGLGIEYPVTVNKNCLFVMGDNRNHSADSRYSPLGQVDRGEVLGKALCIILPGKGSRNDYPDCEHRDFTRIGLIS